MKYLGAHARHRVAGHTDRRDNRAEALASGRLTGAGRKDR